MNSAFIIVGGEIDEDLTQVGLSEHDQVVDALPPDRADQSFRKTVLPRRAGRDRLRLRRSAARIRPVAMGQKETSPPSC